MPAEDGNARFAPVTRVFGNSKSREDDDQPEDHEDREDDSRGDEDRAPRLQYLQVDSVAKRGQPEGSLRGEEQEVGQRGAGADKVGGGRFRVEITQKKQEQARGQEKKRAEKREGAKKARSGRRIEMAGAPVRIQRTKE